MILRAAKQHDVNAMAKIIGDWFTVTPFVPRLHTPEEDRRFIGHAVENADVVVAVDDNQVQGFIVRNDEEIGQLYLAPQARGVGMGTALLERMKADSDQLTLYCFQANKGARRFYERHGFVAEEFSDGSDNEEKCPDIRYVWKAKS